MEQTPGSDNSLSELVRDRATIVPERVPRCRCFQIPSVGRATITRTTCPAGCTSTSTDFLLSPAWADATEFYVRPVKFCAVHFHRQRRSSQAVVDVRKCKIVGRRLFVGELFRPCFLQLLVILWVLFVFIFIVIIAKLRLNNWHRM